MDSEAQQHLMDQQAAAQAMAALAAANTAEQQQQELALAAQEQALASSNFGARHGDFRVVMCVECGNAVPVQCTAKWLNLLLQGVGKQQTLTSCTNSTLAYTPPPAPLIHQLLYPGQSIASCTIVA